jgi:hypothetical protein
MCGPGTIVTSRAVPSDAPHHGQLGVPGDSKAWQFEQFSTYFALVLLNAKRTDRTPRRLRKCDNGDRTGSTVAQTCPQVHVQIKRAKTGRPCTATISRWAPMIGLALRISPKPHMSIRSTTPSTSMKDTL